MSRYLTPSKIGLLVLVQLYSENAFPSEAILPILSFITSHVMNYDGASFRTSQNRDWQKATRDFGLLHSVRIFEELLGSYPSLNGLPGRKLWDQFLGRLWGINSLDALHEFFEKLSLLSANSTSARDQRGGSDTTGDMILIKFSQTSPFGIFVRRSRLEYQRLRFQDCVELWKKLVSYRQPTADYRRRKNPNLGNLSFDQVLLAGEREGWSSGALSELASITYGDMPNGEQEATSTISTNDIEILLDFQVAHIQKFGGRVPSEIQYHFQHSLQHAFLVPSLIHYLGFLEAWRSGNHSAAFDLLHRYFDYTMQNRDRLFYQYALMNLAVLQADFGCHQEAVTAMLESVATARENRDMTCLNFALNWLFHFGRAHPTLIRNMNSNSMLGVGKESLTFLRVKAKETGMWTLWSSVLLSEAKLGLCNGDSIASSLEAIIRATHIMVEKNMKSMFSAHSSLTMALWDRLGLTHMTVMASEIFARCYAIYSVFDDELKVACRRAFISAEKGRYSAAMSQLEALDVNALRSWKPKQYWHLYRGMIGLQRDLHQNNLAGADSLLQQLLQCKSDDVGPDYVAVVECQQIEYMMKRGNFQLAFTKVQTKLSTLRDENQDIALRVRLLLNKATLLDKCGRTRRGFSTALRAANIAWQARLLSLLWQAVGMLANILIAMNEFEAASQLLVATIPRALEGDSDGPIARLYSYLGDANMGLAGLPSSTASKRTEHLTKALTAVQTAFDHYSDIQDTESQCEMMAKKAMIMKISGEMDRASDYAAAYVALRVTSASRASGVV